MTGARQVAETLRRIGVEAVFSVSGNQILSLFDVLPDAGIRIVHARHENAAAYMAEAWAQLRGVPGVCLLTAGPGVTSAVTALANAQASETPVVLLGGASPVSQRGRGAFQEMDQVAVLAPVCKAAWSVDTPAQVAAAVARAWELATAGVPGPVFVCLPVDVLESSDGGEAPAAVALPAVPAVQRASPSQLQEIADCLSAARRPLALVRPALRRVQSAPLVSRLERRIATLVAESPRGLRDPLWGERGAALQDADIVLLLAPQDFVVGFGRVGESGSALIQVATALSPSAGPPGAPVRLRVAADEAQLLADLLPMIERMLPERVPSPASAPPCPDEGMPLHPVAVAEEVRRVLDPSDILVMDGGEFGQWMRAGFRDCPHARLFNGKLGAIGNGIPHAVGAALGRPGSRVYAFLGDGTFAYHAAELDTAVRERLTVTVVVGNDARYGAEWHLQAKRYGPTRTHGTALERRRYELVAEGYGADGMAAGTREELRAALQASLHGASAGVACINVHIRSLPSPAR